MPQPASQTQNKKTNIKVVLLFALFGALIVAAAVVNKTKRGGSGEGVGNGDANLPAPAAPSLSMARNEEAIETGQTTLQIVSGKPEDVAQVGVATTLELRLDTHGQRVVVVEAVFAYDQEALKIEKIEGAGSAFPFEVFSSKQALSNPGIIHIVRGIARVSPDAPVGFLGEGLVAKITAVPLQEGAANLMLDTSKSSYVPADAEKKFMFKGINGESLTVTE